MSKIAFVFPGQGAQYTGMAKDFYEKYAVSLKKLERAQESIPDYNNVRYCIYLEL